MEHKNETGLTSLIKKVEFDFTKGEPAICEKCGEYSDNILVVTAHIFYVHPDYHKLVDDPWQIQGCKRCINHIFGGGGTKPPPTKLLYPVAT